MCVCVCARAAFNKLRSHVFLKKFFHNYQQHERAEQNVNHGCHGSNKRNIQPVAGRQSIGSDLKDETLEDLRGEKVLILFIQLDQFICFSCNKTYNLDLESKHSKDPVQPLKIQFPSERHQKQPEVMWAFSLSLSILHNIQIRCSLILFLPIMCDK